MNLLGLSSEGNDPSTWGTGVKMAIHMTFPLLPQLKLVLDLATPEGCKAELTSVVVLGEI